MVLNEPMVFTGAGYFLGVHAPGRKGLKHFLPAVHHAVLCQALGGRILRETIPDASIGTTFSCSQITPSSDRLKDIRAAQKADALFNRLFIEPSLGLGYPTESVPVLQKKEKYQKPETNSQGAERRPKDIRLFCVVVYRQLRMGRRLSSKVRIGVCRLRFTEAYC